MKKLIAISVFLCVSCVLISRAEFRWDFNTSGSNKMLDTSGNTLLNVVDDGTTGELEIQELDVAGDIDIGGTTNLDAVDIDSDIDVDGTSNLDEVDIDGATDISAAFTQDGLFIQEPPTLVNIDTATVITALDSFIMVVGSNTTGATGGFAVTNNVVALSTAAAYATNGQIVELFGTSDTYTVTFTDDAAFQMDGGTVVLGLGGSVRFRYYNGVWYMQDQQVNVID